MSRDDEILRFHRSERHLHWAIAVPFKLCYVTALILVTVYNPHPHRPFREIVSWVHRLSGLCLAILPACALAWHWRDFRLHLDNVRTAWSWSLADLKWLALMGPAAMSSRVTLPDQGKFNAAEKINFIVVMTSYPVYLLSGLTIWFLGTPYLSWLIHFSMALAATPLVVGHIFMATINPETRVGLQGMLTGRVDRRWARHHYALWYEEHHGKRREEERPVQAAVILPATPAHRGAAPRPTPVPRPAPTAAPAACTAAEVEPMRAPAGATHSFAS